MSSLCKNNVGIPSNIHFILTYTLSSLCLTLILSSNVKPGNGEIFVQLFSGMSLAKFNIFTYDSTFLIIISNIALVLSSGIDCFKCVSINGSNPACEDPFHNNYTSNILERPCMGGRKGRNGLFPASACIKVVGKYCK